MVQAGFGLQHPFSCEGVRVSVRRVVVTGLGAVTPVGNNVTESWRNIVAGVSGAAPVDFSSGGYTALCSAAHAGFCEAAEMLLDRAAKVDGVHPLLGAPLRIAAMRGYEEVRRLVTTESQSCCLCLLTGTLGSLAASS